MTHQRLATLCIFGVIVCVSIIAYGVCSKQAEPYSRGYNAGYASMKKFLTSDYENGYKDGQAEALKVYKVIPEEE